MHLPLHENSPTMHTFLALGDSYTIGESVAVDMRWPVQLVRELCTKGIEFADPKIVATTGWTTDELQQAINYQNLKKNFSLVSLLIGVNNQYRGYSVEVYKKEFESLLKQAITFAGGKPEKVIVLSIPDYGQTPFGKEKDPEKVALEIDHYNRLNKEIAEHQQVNWFDITPISRQVKNDPALIAEDGLHPSGKMYTQWVELIVPYVVNLLKMA